MTPRSIKFGLTGGLLAAFIALPSAAAAAPDLRPAAKSPFDGVVQVMNVGADTAAPSFVTIECKRLGGGSCPDDPGMAAYVNAAFPNKVTVDVPKLAKGKTFTHALTFWKNLKFRPGTYEFRVIADDGNNVAESNEGNTVLVVQKIVP
jgi:hypothetical protein